MKIMFLGWELQFQVDPKPDMFNIFSPESNSKFLGYKVITEAIHHRHLLVIGFPNYVNNIIKIFNIASPYTRTKTNMFLYFY